MAFKPIDPKRDEFRRYLERAGVIEALTKVFVRLLKERPEDPIAYLQHNIGDSMLQADNLAYMKNELEESHMEIQRLRIIIQNVKPDALDETKEEIQVQTVATNSVTDQPLSFNGEDEVKNQESCQEDYLKESFVNSNTESEIDDKLSDNMKNIEIGK